MRNPFCIIMRYCNLSIFKPVSLRHPGILKLKFLRVNHFRDAFRIITLNLEKISETAAEISHFFVFFRRNVKIHQMIALNIIIRHNFVTVRDNRIK